MVSDVVFTFAINYVLALIVLIGIVVVAVVLATESPGAGVVLALLALIVLYDVWRAGGLYSDFVDAWRDMQASV